MGSRGHRGSESGRHFHGVRDRVDYTRSAHQEWNQKYPPPDPRDTEKQWAHQDASYRAYYNSSAPRLEHPPSSYNSPPYSYGYGYDRPEHSRYQSRHGYNYPTDSYWDYRDNYSYYDHDQYRGQRGYPDGGQWVSQDSWRMNPYQDRSYEKGHGGSSHTEQYSGENQTDSSENFLRESDNIYNRGNGEVSSYNHGTLASSKNSGMSSSSFELSQYMNGTDYNDNQSPITDAEPATVAMHHMTAPLKYTIPHAVVSFGPAGQLVRVTPGFSSQENPGQLEFHSMEVILGETQEQWELRKFPGPLTREDLHKVDAIEFAHQRAEACMKDDKLQDKNSAFLMWNLLILLCRQNGQIVGSDIAELLVQNTHSGGTWEQNAPTLIDFSEGPKPDEEPCKGDDLLTGHLNSSSSETSRKALQSYTELLLAGRKKEALESAMSSGLWGHALFLASKMDNRSYTTVLNRFTGQLTANDPLQTFFQLLSRKVPAVATCCGNETWGDWEPHLAVMLSNETGDAAIQQKAIINMGDTLASKRLIHAAHICYLTAYAPFGFFTQKAERLVLLGSSHRLPFLDFAKNSAIQCTELFEYCQTLGGKSFSIPSFQVYKFLYACRLLDCGLVSQAFHYCEVIGQALLRQNEAFPLLTGEVIKLAERLRHSEGHVSGATACRLDQEPDWLQQLRQKHRNLQEGNYGFIETYKPTPGGGALDHDDTRVCSESDLEDPIGDFLTPETDFPYYRGPEKEEISMQQAGEKKEEPTASSWLQASSPSPTVPCAPQMTGSQDFNYHNTDSTEVKTAPLYSPLDHFPSAAEGGEASPGVAMMGVQVKAFGFDYSQGGEKPQNVPQSMASESKDKDLDKPSLQQSTKAGWFSGWFKTQPKEVQTENSEPPKIIPPPMFGLSPPPPPTMGSPPVFPSQHTSEINPFSRKASRQLR